MMSNDISAAGDALPPRLVANGAPIETAYYAPVSQRRLAAAKRAFTTRRVDLTRACRLATAGVAPAIGGVATEFETAAVHRW